MLYANLVQVKANLWSAHVGLMPVSNNELHCNLENVWDKFNRGFYE